MTDFQQFRSLLLADCEQKSCDILREMVDELPEKELAEIGLSRAGVEALLKIGGKLNAQILSYALTRYHEWAQAFTVDSYEDLR